MAHAGQFGTYYSQVIDRLYHALEWRFNEIKDKPGLARESEILAKLLDIMLADQVGHDLHLQNIERSLQIFQRVRHDSFTPKKYAEIISLMGAEEEETVGYSPQLFGHIHFEARYSA